MRRLTLSQMVARATLLGRHARIKSEHSRVIKPNRNGQPHQGEKECARRRR